MQNIVAELKFDRGLDSTVGQSPLDFDSSLGRAAPIRRARLVHRNNTGSTASPKGINVSPSSARLDDGSSTTGARSPSSSDLKGCIGGNLHVAENGQTGGERSWRNEIAGRMTKRKQGVKRVSPLFR